MAGWRKSYKRRDFRGVAKAENLCARQTKRSNSGRYNRIIKGQKFPLLSAKFPPARYCRDTDLKPMLFLGLNPAWKTDRISPSGFFFFAAWGIVAPALG